jgi:predicted dehydrogenase
VNGTFRPTPFFVPRRRFLQTTGAALATRWLGVDGADVASRPRRVGLVGAGWYGKSDLWRLAQVAPIEIVAIADPDRRMLAGALDLAEQRQASHTRPAGHGDHRALLESHELDLVLVGSPDHWHALHAIAAMEAGCDVYLQKPVSVDVLEGEAILATARRLGRVVQVGTQRKSTPHLVEAKRRVVDEGLLGTVGHVDMCCYYHMRANGNPPEQAVPDFLDYETWTGPAPLRPYDGLPHRRWWRTFMEYGNGIVGDMCVHMLDTARWMLGLGWPERIASWGGILVQKEGKSNITDTQTAVFDFGPLQCVWQHRTWGVPPDPEYPWAVVLHGDRGVLKASTKQAEFMPRDGGEPIRFDCLYEREWFPEDLTEDDIELNAAPATRRHLLDFLAAVDARGRPVADIEQGHISSAACILANVALAVGRPLAYDPGSRTVRGDVDATALLARAYRGPWERP